MARTYPTAMRAAGAVPLSSGRARDPGRVTAMQRSRFLFAFLLAVVLMLVVPASARAAPGDLDTTFGGGDGVVTFDSGTNADTGQKILRQPDGKLVVAGDTVNQDLDADLFLARYRKNGTPDPAFGEGGSGIVT